MTARERFECGELEWPCTKIPCGLPGLHTKPGIGMLVSCRRLEMIMGSCQPNARQDQATNGRIPVPFPKLEARARHVPSSKPRYRVLGSHESMFNCSATQIPRLWIVSKAERCKIIFVLSHRPAHRLALCIGVGFRLQLATPIPAASVAKAWSRVG